MIWALFFWALDELINIMVAIWTRPALSIVVAFVLPSELSPLVNCKFIRIYRIWYRSGLIRNSYYIIHLLIYHRPMRTIFPGRVVKVKQFSNSQSGICNCVKINCYLQELPTYKADATSTSLYKDRILLAEFCLHQVGSRCGIGLKFSRIAPCLASEWLMLQVFAR